MQNERKEKRCRSNCICNDYDNCWASVMSDANFLDLKSEKELKMKNENNALSSVLSFGMIFTIFFFAIVILAVIKG